MSVEIKYRCDICRTFKDKEIMRAVVFRASKGIDLLSNLQNGFREHQGVHICDVCIDDLLAAIKGEHDGNV